MRARLLLVIATAILAAAGVARAGEPVFPELTGRVVDQAEILSPATKNQIETMSAEHERATGQQVVVVTLASLQGYTIEQFGYQLGRHWGIGQKGRNNGAILLVAPSARKVRIEVGYGLEGTLTDAQTRIIIEQSILPEFRRGDFNAGILNGAEAMIQVLGGNPLSGESSSNQIDNRAASMPGTVIALWCLLFFGLWGLSLLSWFRHRHDPRRWARRGWTGGGWSGGSFGGGGGSGGGFSGGGGSFGGGGASGSW
jgi:uncharacterized protein